MAGRKGKRADSRPARSRYWIRRTLEKNKIKKLMKYCKMEINQAIRYWSKVRKGRVPDKFLN